MKPMTVAVGSINPTKIGAAKQAVCSVWPDAQIIPVNVPSGVGEQPVGDDETIAGAINRARTALEAVNADMGVGIEGGVSDTRYGMFVCGWSAVIDRDERVGLGNSGHFLLPEVIARKIRAGGELGPEMDRFTGLHDVKRNLGAVGIFTGGRITRTEALATSVLFALTRFIHPEFYNHAEFDNDET